MKSRENMKPKFDDIEEMKKISLFDEKRLKRSRQSSPDSGIKW